MSYTPRSKLSSPPQFYPESNYRSSYRNNYGGTYDTINNKAMSQQLEKCWKELSTGKYSSNNNRRNSASSSAIEEEVRNIYDQVALQVRRGGDSGAVSVVSSQLNSNYSKSEMSFINMFRVPKPPRSYGFSEASNSRMLSSLQSPPMTTTNTTTTKNKMMYTLPTTNDEVNAYLVDNDKECMVPGMIFFIIGFFIIPILVVCFNCSITSCYRKGI
ncbi:hypothetical protein LY90DRAFT_705166 [Neocallimastix californiae]|uniref:Uncharacterized protein n=1 Tax=Neocallimastix californiae TaxID=1754190 RepID=A0A1Y2BDS8_9FUNG|nr:hypothetical protein LY90DRAFT_705166 [Neocallimastix californiae]|eukprot:ORY32971.1 hypothetical protein LY90DRAFT_705166 [Neocallimastix californiae]